MIETVAVAGIAEKPALRTDEPETLQPPGQTRASQRRFGIEKRDPPIPNKGAEQSRQRCPGEMIRPNGNGSCSRLGLLCFERRQISHVVFLLTVYEANRLTPRR